MITLPDLLLILLLLHFLLINLLFSYIASLTHLIACAIVETTSILRSVTILNCSHTIIRVSVHEIGMICISWSRPFWKLWSWISSMFLVTMTFLIVSFTWFTSWWSWSMTIASYISTGLVIVMTVVFVLGSVMMFMTRVIALTTPSITMMIVMTVWRIRMMIFATTSLIMMLIFASFISMGMSMIWIRITV